MRCTFLALVLVATLGSPAAGQVQPIRPAPGGVMLTFQDADLGFVLSALAQTAGINLVYNDLPAKPITLRTATPVPIVELPQLIRSIAISNGITVFEEGGFVRLRGTGSGDPPAVDDRQLFIMRLRHARAPELAATLQQLFGGGAVGPVTAATQRAQTLSQQLRTLQQQGVNIEVPTQVLGQFGVAGPLEGNVLIVPDETTNSLLIRATAADYQVVQQAVGILDLRPLQVLIEVVIAEVRRTDDLNVGTSFTADDADDPGSTTATLEDDTTPDNFTVRFSRTGTVNVEATLAALAASGDVRILSRPVIQAQNNQEARILVGSQRPFVSVSRSLPTDEVTRDQVVQYREVGTSLTIVPTINPEGYVNLLLTQEVSSATNETQFDAPIISTREATTQLLARDGQTIVIGGLVDHQEDRSRAGIPLLKDIPVLGYLFGTTRNQDASSELFLFLTPHIVETDEDADRLKEEIENNTELLRPYTPIEPLIPPDTTGLLPAAPAPPVQTPPPAAP